MIAPFHLLPIDRIVLKQAAMQEQPAILGLS